jgi:hypothetical protein
MKPMSNFSIVDSESLKERTVFEGFELSNITKQNVSMPSCSLMERHL